MNKDKQNIIVQFLIVAACLYWIIHYFLSHQDNLAIIHTVQYEHILFLVLTTIAINIIYSLKLLIILKKLGLKQIPYIQWLYVFLVSRFINLHMTQGAILYRSLYLKNQFGFSYIKSISLNVFFTWFETVLLLVFALIVFALFDPSFIIGPFSILYFLSISIFIFLITPFIARRCFSTHIGKYQKIQWLFDKFRELAANITDNMKDLSLIIKFTLYSLVTFLLQIIWMSICTQALALDINLSGIVLLVVVIQLSGLVQIIPGNLGITELASGTVTKIIGWNLGAGIIISAIQRVVVYLSFLIWGICFIWPYKYLQHNKTAS